MFVKIYDFVWKSLPEFVQFVILRINEHYKDQPELRQYDAILRRMRETQDFIVSFLPAFKRPDDVK